MEADSIPSAQEIRDWAGDNAGRRLAEARAVVAALEAIQVKPQIAVVETEKSQGTDLQVGLPDDAPSDDIDRGEPSEAAAPGSHPPPKDATSEPVEDVLEDSAAPVDVSVERPKPQPQKANRLPRRVRALERIFRIRDAARAGETLRNYIHRRHARADKVLARLDKYVNTAPKERVIPVLRNALKHRPGPKTRRWLRRTLKRLRS